MPRLSGGDGAGEAAGEALSRVGLPALPILVEIATKNPQQGRRTEAVQALCLMARIDESLVPPAAEALLQILRSSTATPRDRAAAAASLEEIDWREARHAIQDAFDRGIIGDSWFGQIDFEDWLNDHPDGGGSPCSLRDEDPLQRFLPRHRARFLE